MFLFQVVTLLGGEDCFHKMLTIFRSIFFKCFIGWFCFGHESYDPFVNQ